MIKEYVNSDIRSPQSVTRLKNKASHSGFNTTSPRFKDMVGPPGLNTTKASQKHQKLEARKPYRPSAASKQFTRLKKLKKQNFEQNLQKEKSKTSFMFQSKSKRFVTPKPIRVENIGNEEFKDLANHVALLGGHQKNLYMSPIEGEKSIPAVSYTTIISKNVPFNSHAARFAQKGLDSTTPGPGSYGQGKIRTEEELQRAL